MKKPFWRRQRNAWYLLHHGRQICLGREKDEAFRRYHRLMSEMPAESPQSSGPTAGEIIDQFLAWSESHQAPQTTAQYRWYLIRLNSAVGHVAVADLKPYHVTRWLERKGWKGNCANLAVRCAVRPFSWARKQGIIPSNPLAETERPAATPRECYLSDSQFSAIMAAIPDREFQDFVEFARETGARPQEIRAIERRHFGTNTITFPRNESKGKRRQRVIVLNAKALAIVKRLSVKHPDGPMFRNRDGNPWKANAIVCRCQRLSRKLGFDFCMYAVRHSWITNALLNGVEPMTVATLAGHANINMIWSTYQKLSMQQDHMRKAAEQAVRKQA
jgi:integrase